MVGITAYQSNSSPTTRNTRKLDKLDPNKINISIINIRVNKQESACKVVPVLNEAPRNEDMWGNGDRAPRFLKLGRRRRSVVSFTVRPLYTQ
jgi:hypothetical protein